MSLESAIIQFLNLVASKKLNSLVKFSLGERRKRREAPRLDKSRLVLEYEMLVTVSLNICLENVLIPVNNCLEKR